MDQIKLRRAIEASWGKDTSYSPVKYAKEANPALGQCAVTAAVLQDYLGGVIMAANVHLPDSSVTRHYWLRTHSIDLDLTWQQFPKGSYVTDIESKIRSDVMENEWMRQRYRELKSRVDNFIKQL